MALDPRPYNPAGVMSHPYTSAAETGPNLGLIVLQSDETIELDMRRLLPSETPLYISRVPSGTEVTVNTLRNMAGHLTQAANLFPRGLRFDTIGYGCTSGTSQIGTSEIARLTNVGADTKTVTEPVSALLAACEQLDLKRIGFLSPYIEPVSKHLRDILCNNGITTPAFGSFEEATEAKVVRIDTPSIIAAATQIAAQSDIQALFLSCTNLRTLDAIPELEDTLGITVLSSNLVLAWHMARLSGSKLAHYKCRLSAAP